MPVRTLKLECGLTARWDSGTPEFRRCYGLDGLLVEDWGTADSRQVRAVPKAYPAMDFNTRICSGEGHPLTLYPGGLAWCRDTSNYVWRIEHAPSRDGEALFYWNEVGVWGMPYEPNSYKAQPWPGTGHEALEPFVQAWRELVAKGMVKDR